MSERRKSGRPAGHHIPSTWDARVRMTPTADQVARLASTHGLEVCIERWSWVTPSHLYLLGRQGARAA